MVVFTSPFAPPAITDVPAAFGDLAATRAAGRVATSASYERLMMACVESGRGLAAYRLYEEAAADGLRWRQLSREARSVLQPRLPPEAEAVGHRRSRLAVPRRLLRAGRRQPGELCRDALPELWVSPSASVATFDCRPGSGRDAALAAAWEAVASREAPVLMRGVGEAWPALEAWDLRLLRPRWSLTESGRWRTATWHSRLAAFVSCAFWPPPQPHAVP